MPVNYSQHFNPKKIPQSEAMRPDQMPNSAGGFAWAVSDKTRLDRFLFLGCEGGSYYASEQKLSKENAQAVIRLIGVDGPYVVNRIVEVSEGGKAYKNDPALFALALCFSEGDVATKTEASDALPHVARIGTHLFNFLGFVNDLRGWGRCLRTSVANWYQDKSIDDLSFQVAKYAQRNGWSHRDALRLSHPKTTEDRNWLYRYIVGKQDALADNSEFLSSVEFCKTSTDVKAVSELIRKHRLPREVLSTELLNSEGIWEALFEQMPMTAMIRNLATMTRIGLIKPMGKATSEAARRLGDREALKKARVHPIAVLAALITYASGQGARGQHTWSPVTPICDALDQAFYLAFDAVEPTGKRICLALDVSGSMNSGTICGVPGLTPRIGAAAMALVLAATEANNVVVAFTAGNRPSMWSNQGIGTGTTVLDISPRQRLDDVVAKTSALPMGGTDCALPMMWALQNKVECDAFIVLTDSETWHGDVHPAQALAEYRRKMNIPSKLIVCSMVANNFTIADPQDAGMLDVVGFSTDTPTVISNFIRE